jgi:lipopolysaccharide transport system permease protein
MAMKSRLRKERVGKRREADGGVVEQTTIEPYDGWRLIDWRELLIYRELLLLLVYREIKGKYAQTILGIGWAILQPFFTMVVFSVVFGRLAKIPSEGIPYPIFSYAALVPWTYFSGSLGSASASLISSSRLISKVYFPRLFIPITPVLAGLVDFMISLLFLFGMMLFYRVTPTKWALLLPLLIVLMMLSASGLGMWFAPLAMRYRDINYVRGFMITLLMYASPIIYPISLIPQQFRLLYGLNPVAGVIEGFRAALLGATPMPWDVLAVSTVSSIAIAVSGAFYFRRMERTFADIS